MTGFHVALATNPTVSMMSRPSPVALAALVPPVATLASVLATALALGFVGCLRAHRFDLRQRALRQLLANAAIASSRVASYPYVSGERPLRWL